VTTDADTIETLAVETPAVDENTVATPETVNEATTETAAESDDGEQKEPLRDEKGKFKGVQARIDELTRARREAERSAEYWKGLATQTAQPSAESAAEPTEDQFDDYASFIRALTKWEVAQVARQTASSAVERAESLHRNATWADRQEVAKASLPDYDTVVGSSDMPIAEHVRDALLDSERGPELAYHLARNPAFADQLNSMSATRAALELGRLETQLDTAPEPKPISKAPAPITPITTGTNVKVDLKDSKRLFGNDAAGNERIRHSEISFKGGSPSSRR